MNAPLMRTPPRVARCTAPVHSRGLLEEDARRGSGTKMLVLCVAVLTSLAVLVREYRGMLRSAGNSVLISHGLATHRGGGCEPAVAQRERAKQNATSSKRCELGGIVSYWSSDPKNNGLRGQSVVAGRTVHFERIAEASVRNHAAAADALRVPYTLSRRGHPRCGKMRAFATALRSAREGDWLLFLDADAALKCPFSRDAPRIGRAVCRVAAATTLQDRLATVSLVVGSRFGFFAARNDAWARDFFDRFAQTLERKQLLCATSTFPENAAANELITQADRCHYLRQEKLVDTNGMHLVGVQAKRNASQVLAYVKSVESETRCWTRGPMVY